MSPSKIFALIPARFGSQRLTHKNLREFGGIPLIMHAIRKCKRVRSFDEIWVSADAEAFRDIALSEGVNFHQRTAKLANGAATSEDYVYEFLSAHECDYVFQVHTIAPLLLANEVRKFVETMVSGDYDVLLSVVSERIECVIDGEPINFSFDRKTNSQNLTPVQRITWSITGWRSKTFCEAHDEGKCATYAGRIGYHEIEREAGHIIKTGDDLRLAEVMFEHLKSAAEPSS